MKWKLGESKLPGDLKEVGLSLLAAFPFLTPFPFDGAAVDAVDAGAVGAGPADVIPLYNIYNKYKLNTSS